MKIRINLLPHREVKKAARKRQFTMICLFSALLGAGIGFLGYAYNAQQIAKQEVRNKVIDDEIVKLKEKNIEIVKIETHLADLKNRKNAVEKLQANRAESTKIFDQLARLIDAEKGVVLKQVKQLDGKITVSGFSQSSARVANFMRALEYSPVFEQPVLSEIKSAALAGSKNGQKTNEFTLNVNLERKVDVVASGAARSVSVAK